MTNQKANIQKLRQIDLIGQISTLNVDDYVYFEKLAIALNNQLNRLGISQNSIIEINVDTKNVNVILGAVA